MGGSILTPLGFWRSERSVEVRAVVVELEGCEVAFVVDVETGDVKRVVAGCVRLVSTAATG
jgi:hypothetical protein